MVTREDGNEAKKRDLELEIPRVPSVEAAREFPETSGIRGDTAEAVHDVLNLSVEQQKVLIPLIRDLRNLSEQKSDVYFYQFDNDEMVSLLSGIFDSVGENLDGLEQRLAEYIHLALKNGRKVTFNSQEEIVSLLKLVVKIYKGQIPVKIEKDPVVDSVAPKLGSVQEEYTVTPEERATAEKIFEALSEKRSERMPLLLMKLFQDLNIDPATLKGKSVMFGNYWLRFPSDNFRTARVYPNSLTSNFRVRGKASWGESLSSDDADFYMNEIMVGGSDKRKNLQFGEYEQLMWFKGEPVEEIISVENLISKSGKPFDRAEFKRLFDSAIRSLDTKFKQISK